LPDVNVILLEAQPFGGTFLNDVNVRSDVLTAMVMESILLQPVANMSIFWQKNVSPCRWRQFVPLRYRKFLPDYAASHF
jgi:hypothetical protein